MHLIEWKKAPRVAGLSDRALKVGEALGEFVALRGFVVHAATEDFYFGFDVVETLVNEVKVLADGSKFASTKGGKRINKTGDLGETSLEFFVNAVEALLKVGIFHVGKV
jgi:hypothetical protein